MSVAVSALRKELGDELFVREGRGIKLTAGGRRLAALASEILGLAEQARRSVQDVPGQSRLMQIAVTNVVAEHVGPLVDAFTAREPGLEIQIDVGARRTRSPTCWTIAAPTSRSVPPRPPTASTRSRRSRSCAAG